MWDSLRNFKTSELTIRDELSRLERDWLVGCLLSKSGIRDALYKDGDSHRLIVEYDADRVSGIHVLDFIRSCGLRAHAVAPAGRLMRSSPCRPEAALDASPRTRA